MPRRRPRPKRSRQPTTGPRATRAEVSDAGRPSQQTLSAQLWR
jgi:hypothetical protein